MNIIIALWSRQVAQADKGIACPLGFKNLLAEILKQSEPIDVAIRLCTLFEQLRSILSRPHGGEVEIANAQTAIDGSHTGKIAAHGEFTYEFLVVTSESVCFEDDSTSRGLELVTLAHSATLTKTRVCGSYLRSQALATPCLDQGVSGCCSAVIA